MILLDMNISNLKTYFFVILCVLFWSGNFVLGRFVHNDIEPIELAFFRWFFVFIITLPILIIKFNKLFKIFTQNYVILISLALLGISGFNTILYIALTTTTATNALIINSSIPVLIIIISYFILKISVTRIQFGGVILSTLGVLYIVLKGDINNLLTLEFNNGDFLVILSSFIWALYSVIVKFKPKELHDIEFFTTIVFLGMLFLLPLYLYQGYSLQQEINLVSKNYYVFMYVSVFASTLSYYFWHYGIHHIGASKTGQFTHLMPIFGSFWAYIFLGETLEIYHLIGILGIALGIYLSLFYRQNSF